MTKTYGNKVLVTGATGFLGSYLCRLLLAEGYEVRGMKRENSSTLLVQDIESKMDWTLGDIMDINSIEDAMQDIDMVFHCAAIIGFDPKSKLRWN